MFTYNGVTITVLDSGKFTAMKNGEELSSGSLAGIKKKIDGKSAFESFKALAAHWDVYEPATVIGGKRARAAWRGDEWTLSTGKTVLSVLDDTPENRALVAKIEKKKEEISKAKDQLDKELKAIESKLAHKRPPSRQA